MTEYIEILVHDQTKADPRASSSRLFSVRKGMTLEDLMGKLQYLPINARLWAVRNGSECLIDGMYVFTRDMALIAHV